MVSFPLHLFTASSLTTRNCGACKPALIGFRVKINKMLFEEDTLLFVFLPPSPLLHSDFGMGVGRGIKDTVQRDGTG
jgi:hypothetical protein